MTIFLCSHFSGFSAGVSSSASRHVGPRPVPAFPLSAVPEASTAAQQSPILPLPPTSSSQQLTHQQLMHQQLTHQQLTQQQLTHQQLTHQQLNHQQLRHQQPMTLSARQLHPCSPPVKMLTDPQVRRDFLKTCPSFFIGNFLILILLAIV